jgi:outer membrane biosynthesis protein TonB
MKIWMAAAFAAFGFCAPALAETMMTGPVPVSRVAPVAPEDTWLKGEEGLVTVRVSVGADGAPATIDIVTETPAGKGFGKALGDAVAQWRWAAGNGGTVEVTHVFKSRVKAGVKNLRPSNFVQAVWPESAAKAGLTGEATAVVSVTPDGKPFAARTIRESGPGLGEAAEAALMQWTFEGVQRYASYHVTFVFGPGADGGTARMSAAGPCNVAPEEVQAAPEPAPVCAPRKVGAGAGAAGQVRAKVRADGSIESFEVTISRPRDSGNGSRAAAWAQENLKVCPSVEGGYAHYCATN